VPAQPEIEDCPEPPTARTFNSEEASSYLMSMTSEMRNIALWAKLPFLAYLLDMALQESVRLTVEGGKTPEGGESPSQI
jgi:hypothetical protein